MVELCFAANAMAEQWNQGSSSAEAKGREDWVGASLGKFDPFCILCHEIKTNTLNS